MACGMLQEALRRAKTLKVAARLIREDKQVEAAFSGGCERSAGWDEVKCFVQSFRALVTLCIYINICSQEGDVVQFLS